MFDEGSDDDETTIPDSLDDFRDTELPQDEDEHPKVNPAKVGLDQFYIKR